MQSLAYFLQIICKYGANMLIEFKVSNYRSILEEQTLSLVANNYDHSSLPENLIHPELAGIAKVKLLKGAAIYGPNASGKSNVLAALQFITRFIKNSATKIAPNGPTGNIPFCLDFESAKSPSVFEITVSIEGIRYKYVVSLDTQRVHNELLIAYPKGQAQKWFERTYDKEKQEYNWSHSTTFFKLDKDLCEKTRPNSLFVSTAAQFNNAPLTIIYNWFNKGIHFVDLGAESSFNPLFTATLIEDKKPQVATILELLKSADFGITGADIKHEELSAAEVKEKFPPSVVREMESDGKLTGIKTLEISLTHQGKDNSEHIVEFAEESAGTRRFFALIGPWLDILEHGYTVLIDELETSLHPLLVKEFLKLLFSNAHNSKGAQIIFTTHNPILLDTEVMRRDQVWFTEKDERGATHLYPLTDYKPRKNESLARGYLAGRYGALPFIPEGLKMR